MLSHAITTFFAGGAGFFALLAVEVAAVSEAEEETSE
jgi:hypothetical protein